MFIALRVNANGELRRSDTFQTWTSVAEIHAAPTELMKYLVTKSYKHFVPTGLR